MKEGEKDEEKEEEEDEIPTTPLPAKWECLGSDLEIREGHFKERKDLVMTHFFAIVLVIVATWQAIGPMQISQWLNLVQKSFAILKYLWVGHSLLSLSYSSTYEQRNEILMHIHTMALLMDL